MTDTPRREFLGWDGPALPRVAQWLVQHRAEVSGRADGDLADVIVALPGRRAARRLEQHLARELPRGAAAPRLVPVGHLPDELLLPERPFAGRLLRTLLWRDALRGLPDALRAALLPRPPAADDVEGWLALAEEVRTLHAEVAAEDCSFDRVAPAARRLAGEGEGRRWDALAAARAAFLAALDAHGQADPHEGRRAALRAGALDPRWRVVLAGVADPNALVRDLVGRLGARATVLVLAPDDLRDAFDAVGALRTQSFAARPIDLPADAWRLAQRPDDQAEAAVAWVAARAARLRPDEVVVGVPDPEVVPHLQRRLREAGAAARPAEGRPLPRTSPARLLEALAAHLSAPSFATLAALLRHPALTTALRAGGLAAEDELPEHLDGYHARHLPDALPRAWPGLRDGRPREREDAQAVERAAHAVEALLAPLRDERPVREWAAPLAALLAQAFPGELDESHDDQRRLAGALRRLGAALDELAALPVGAGGHLSAGAALRLLLRSVERDSVPEPPDPQAIELLGWLELALDDAPALVVTGLNEGRVPAARRGHPLLPDGLRRELGLPDDDRRLARDAYILQLLARARAADDLALVTGRLGQDGDPLRPSRLLFLAPDDVAIARARRFGQPQDAAPAAAVQPAPAPRRLPRLPRDEPVKVVSVTDFAFFMASPYRYYVERALGLKRAADDARELDPPGFGSLAHDVLAGLAEEEPARLRDAGALARWLEARLQRVVRATWGDSPPPAVQLQVQHLGGRLAGLAEWQAEQQRAGWRVVRAEWRAPQRPFPVDGGELLLKGRIDRVDVHDDGRWRVIDYKTGDGGDGPRATHGPTKQGRWKDLQLPLYLVLAEALREELPRLAEAPQVGYVVLPRERPEPEGWWLPADWSGDELDAALAEARRVGGAILRGGFGERGRWDTDDEVFAALLGEGLLTEADPEADEG